MKILTYAAAIREALDEALARDPAVFVIGLGVPDRKGIFGTTLGLADKHGADRVMDMPTSENGMTGVAIGAAISGMRPVMVHQRLDFALLAMDQIVNQAAKWRSMFDGNAGRCPIVIRLIVGRGWGQGPQHSQALHAWFAHVPGLKVVAPASPRDAKGMLVAALRQDDPVIFIEHRWLHGVTGEIPAGEGGTSLAGARVVRTGADVTIVAISYMVLEAQVAAAALAEQGISAEVIDARSLRPLDSAAVAASVCKTGRLVVADIGWITGGIGAEIVAGAVESSFNDLRAAPERIGLLDIPTPSSPALAKFCYPGVRDIMMAAGRTMGRKVDVPPDRPDAILDVPDPTFTGPF